MVSCWWTQSQRSHACYHPWTTGSAKQTPPLHPLSVPEWPLPLKNRSHAGAHYNPAVTVPTLTPTASELDLWTFNLLAGRTDCKRVSWSQGSRVIWIMCVSSGDVRGHFTLKAWLSHQLNYTGSKVNSDPDRWQTWSLKVWSLETAALLTQSEFK